MTTIPLSAIEEAYERLSPVAHRTPVLTCSELDRRSGAQLWFKCENFQKIGAFKFRGAYNTVSLLTDDERRHGVVTHSSGNHAQAVALAARLHGIPAHIVMPRTATAVKQAAVRGYGAEVTLCEPSLASREETTEEVIARTGAILVHGYDDPRIVAGQATATKELLEDVPGLDLVLVPVGGGGLASGAALAAHYFSPTTRVIGVEPSGADDAYRSLETGRIQPSVEPRTIADGLLTNLGEVTFAILREHLERIVLVDDDATIDAMRLVWERMKIVIEPSSAVPVAAVLSGRLDVRGLRVGILLSGGNVDLGKLPWASGT